MPRNKKMRYCRGIDGYNLYKPSGIPLSQMKIIELGLDELEAMRLCDSDGMQQEEAADIMGVSRGTIQRLLESGRRKILIVDDDVDLVELFKDVLDADGRLLLRQARGHDLAEQA